MMIYFCLCCIVNFFMAIMAQESSSIIFSNMPITHPKKYADIANLWQLDMSNQTTFEFPKDRVLLIHNNLARFKCNNCSVHSIYKESFSMLPQMSHLELNHNNLSYIDADAFENNKLLKNVQLIGNNLVQFNSEGALRHVSHLSFLILDQNYMFDINKVSLHLPWLGYFSCKYCNTTYVSKSTMNRWPRLGYLHLSYNHVSVIEYDAFQDMDRFKQLNVKGNLELTSITLKSRTLLKLNAEGCSLEGTLNLSKLIMLEELNVRGNKISNINENGFHHTPGIKRILLDDNNIKMFPIKFLEIPLASLETLCIDKNPLQPCEFLNAFIFNYNSKKLRRGCLDDEYPSKQFEQILASKNGVAIYSKSEISENTTVSETVDHSFKNIVYIEEDYFYNMYNVTNVIMDNNNDLNFPKNKAFLRSNSITKLSLVNCGISTIYDQTFELLPNIVSINLRSNKIQSLHSVTIFRNCLNLVHLDLSKNLIEFIEPNQFQQSKFMRTLHLDQNRLLSSKPGSQFLVSTSLQKISCRFCGFFQIDGITLSGLINLTELDLSHNFITTVDENAFHGVLHLNKIDLSYNFLYTFVPDLNHMKVLNILCLSGNTNFDFDYSKNQPMIENCKKINQLEKQCDEMTFSQKLLEVYNNKTSLTISIREEIYNAKILQRKIMITYAKIGIILLCSLLVFISMLQSILIQILQFTFIFSLSKLKILREKKN